MSFPALYPRYCPEGLAEVPPIEGFCHPDWECVRARFAENFREHLERGGAVCVYHQGRKVVDLWAGEKYPGIPWTSDMLTCSFSMGKGLAALGLALLHSRGHLNYDEKVSTYWPEFGCNGKEAVTVRELLSHQTGACNVEEKLTEEVLRNPSQLAAALAKTKMEFGPSEGQNGYMALTIGWYMDVLCRKVDPQQRGIDQLLREEITSKLGSASEVYCGLPSPSELDRSRIASLNCFSTFDLVLRGKFSSEFVWNLAFTPSSYAARAFKNPNFLGKLKSYSTERVRTLCIPGANFITSARGAAGLYDAILSGTGSVGFKPETLLALSEPAEERFDVVIRQPTAFSLGFGKPASPASSCFGSSNKSFGAYGTGGQFAFADPDAELAYAYCTNRLGTHLCDPRDLALRQVVYSNLARLGHPSRDQPPDKTLEKHLKAGTAKETTCFDWFLRLFGGFFLWLG